MEALGPEPDTTADYTRLAAVPLVLGPAGITDLAKWFSTSAAAAGALVWRSPDEPDPGSEADRVVGTIMIGGADRIFVPPDTPARDLVLGGASTAPTERGAVPPRAWSAAIYTRSSPAAGESLPAFEARIAGRLLWDTWAQSTSPLPIPYHPDQSIVAAWGEPTVTPGLLPEDLPGAMAEAPPPSPPYLLTTHVDDGDGELDPRLLRAPVTGTMRFERYQHLVLTAQGSLVLRRPGRTGRVAFDPAALADLDPAGLADAFDDVADIDRIASLAYEDVDADSVLEMLPAVIIDQLRRFGELTTPPPYGSVKAGLGRALRENVVWLLRIWQAAAEVDWLLALVPSSVSGTLRQLIPRGWMPAGAEGDAAIRAAVTLLSAHGDAMSQLRDFTRDVFARLLLGDSWSDLGVALDAGAAEPGTPEREALDFTWLSQRRIACFAGCPVGRAGAVWVPEEVVDIVWDDGAKRFNVDPATLHRTSFSTFELEAFYQARIGGLGDPVADHGEARGAGAVSDSELRDYGAAVVGPQVGTKAVLRLVEPERPKRAYTTVDWMREAVRGAVRRRYQLPLLDFEAYADAGHAVRDLVEWDRWLEARGLRDGLDTLGGVRFGSASLHGTTLAWWVANTRLADSAGHWPSSFTRSRIDPGPRNVYRRAGIAPSGRDRVVTTGVWHYVLSSVADLPDTKDLNQGAWDEFSLLAALKAAAAVRDGRALADPDSPAFVPVHPALVLAVAETEGYRNFTPQVRIRDVVGSFWAATDSVAFDWAPDAASAALVLSQGPEVAQGSADQIALETSWLHPCELDLMAYPRGGTRPPPDVEARWALDRLTRVDFEGQPGTPATGDLDPARSLLDLDALAFGDAEHFAAMRIRAKWAQDPGTSGRPVDVVRFWRLTRDLEWVQLAVQAAIFQWVHLQLHTMRGYLSGEVYSRVDELVDPAQPPPAPGADALDPARRDYIAYWALVYLAFNTSPSVWNKWVDLAARRRRTGQRISDYVVYHLDNRGTDPAQPSVWSLTNMTRFAVSLDAFLRLPWAGITDRVDPRGRRWSG
jgi:hypothetical protein